MTKSNEIAKAMRAITEFREELKETAPAELDCRKLELEVQRLLHEVGRGLMVEVLQRADVKEPVVEVLGERWGNRRETVGTYTTMFGDIEVPRGTFQKGGGGRVVIPLELRLGIVEKRYTPQAARVLTRAIALMTAEDAEGLLAETGVVTVSKSTLHRVPHAISARYELRKQQINDELRESEEVPDAAVTVQVSMDGVMVPQDGEHAKQRGRKTDAPQAPRHEQRYGAMPGDAPCDNDDHEGRAWHEACVGTVSYWDADGEHLKTLYVARMPESGKGTVADELEGELCVAIGERPDLHVCFAADGNPTQWQLLASIGSQLPPKLSNEATWLLDFYHCAGYLERAANAVYEDSPATARITASNWGEQLKELDDGALRVLKAMRYQRDRLPSGARRDIIETCIGFLANQARHGRLEYAQARRRHCPIGTGVVEAAAKTVVNVRMKRAGARFSQHGGQTVMLFRTAILSDRFDRLSSCLERTYVAGVKAAA
jgi:hypothetical protein